MDKSGVLQQIYDILLERKAALPRDSYTARLFKEGEDAILKKTGEEAAEVLLASKSGREEALVHEVADLWFHTLVLLAYHGTPVDRIFDELEGRLGKPGFKTRGRKE
ncbi:MAG: phosphoribosyl-ATP diphosphatase [bacterium]|nr:phosphoribosyl-ATP diphosphatase [bacterium]